MELLELGADASLRKKQGKTALEYAEKYMYRKHEIAQLLRNPPALRLGPRQCGLADAALPPGTRLRVNPRGDGAYLRWERQRFGANTHFVRFDGPERAAEQPVQLKSLGRAAWSVLPYLTVELEIVEVTGATATLGGVSLGWAVERLGQTIGEQRGVASELLRLIVKDQALDDKGSLLLPVCGIVSVPMARSRVCTWFRRQLSRPRRGMWLRHP